MKNDISLLYTKFVHPIYKKIENNVYDLIGTFIVLEIHHSYFLLTASHVLEKFSDPPKTPYTVNNLNVIVEIIAEKCIGTQPINNQKCDKIDLAFIELGKETIKVLNQNSFLRLQNLDLLNRPNFNTLYTFTGFPCSKAPYKPQYGKAGYTPFAYTAQSVDIEIYNKLKMDHSTHIIIEFDKKSVRNANNEIREAPSPIGISGGGVWLFDKNLKNITDLRNRVKLVGINIEHHSNEKVLVGTKINLMINLIKKFYPNLIN